MFGSSKPQEPLSLAAHIESILFFLAKEVTIKDLAAYTETTTKEVKSALKELQEILEPRGLSLVIVGSRVALVTDSRSSEILAGLQKQEEEKGLSRSALETLSIVAYKAPVVRAEIDYIRGVNSTYALRNLIQRGLVQKVKQEGATHYTPTVEALRFIGVESQEHLPHFKELQEKAAHIIKEEQETEKQGEQSIFSEDTHEEV